jgi:hypothetical protein
MLITISVGSGFDEIKPWFIAQSQKLLVIVFE